MEPLRKILDTIWKMLLCKISEKQLSKQMLYLLSRATKSLWRNQRVLDLIKMLEFEAVTFQEDKNKELPLPELFSVILKFCF